MGGDAPGLVLGRMVCQVINEAAFALGEGVGSAGDIDAGMVHGLNYPRGPLSWADEIGLDHVCSVLEGLHDELGEERYRLAPELRAVVVRASGAPDRGRVLQLRGSELDAPPSAGAADNPTSSAARASFLPNSEISVATDHFRITSLRKLAI